MVERGDFSNVLTFAPTELAARSELSLPRAPATVDDELAPCDKRGLVAAQVKGGRGDFLGPRHAADGLRRGHLAISLFRVGIFLEPLGDEWRLDAARADAVGPDALGRMVEGEALGEADHGEFRGAIGEPVAHRDDAPARAKASAMALPMPAAAPVTREILFWRLNMRTYLPNTCLSPSTALSSSASRASNRRFSRRSNERRGRPSAAARVSPLWKHQPAAPFSLALRASVMKSAATGSYWPKPRRNGSW